MTLPIKTFQTINGLDQNTQLVQRNVQNAVNPVLSTPLLDGTLLTGQVIPASGIMNVGHQLGRPAKGCIVVAATPPTIATNSVATPYQITSEQTSPNTQLVLHFTTGAGATISLWVF